jgi:1-acyl-sn-glycerol-3-phosphate acyltransferase
MNPVKRIFCIVFAILALLLFAATLLFTVIAYTIIFNTFSKNRAPHAAHRVSQVWAQSLLMLFLIRLHVKGKELIDPKESYIIISNHKSQIDIPAMARACRNTFRFLAKAELVKIPLLGYIIKNLYLTVDRKNVQDRSRSMELMKSSLNEGISVVIFPEGTRNRTDAPLLDFRDGAFRLAIEAQRPLAVLTFIDMEKVNSAKDPFVICPGHIHAVWSPPIDTRGMTQDDLPALKERARQLMLLQLENRERQ